MAMAWLPLLLVLTSAAALRKVEEGRKPPRLQEPPPEPPHHKCKVAEQDCSIGALQPREITLVHPDPAVSRTRCLFSTNSEYAFQVVPRNPEKVMIYFEGGGACWNAFSTVVMQGCWRDQVWAFPVQGSIMSSAAANPFADFTVVMVNACSGDLHSGNATRDYRDDRGKNVEQRGYYNTRSVLDWVKANLAWKPIPELLIVGESAGAIGVQVWSRTVLSELPYDRVGVVVDSYTAVFPEHFQGNVFNAFRICDLDLLQLEELTESCRRKELTISDVFEAALRDFPDVPFAMLNSKFDTSQETFYKMAALTAGVMPVDAAALYRQRLELLRRFNRYPNFLTYLSAGTQHVFINGYMPERKLTRKELDPMWGRLPSEDRNILSDKYIASAAGVGHFMAMFPPERGATLRSECELLDARQMQAMKMIRYPDPSETDTCDQELFNKTFTAP